MSARLLLQRIEPKAYHKLIWTQEAGRRWTCGPLTVEHRWIGARECWLTTLHGKVICREYGYHWAAAAMRAAPRLGAVVRLIETQTRKEK